MTPPQERHPTGPADASPDLGTLDPSGDPGTGRETRRALSGLYELILARAGGHAEKLRYLVVGGWNTLFGYLLYALLLFAFGRNAYLWILLPGNAIAITQNYLTFKFLVFRTRGNYRREYLRFAIVYLPTLVANLVVLPALVHWLGLNPVAGQALFTLAAVVVTYLGHKRFTFRARRRS